MARELTWAEGGAPLTTAGFFCSIGVGAGEPELELVLAAAACVMLALMPGV